MSVRTFILFFFFLGLNCSGSIIAQDVRGKEVQKLLYKIEEGLTSGSVDKFSAYFGNRNYLSLSNGTNGYFSANQSYYIIKDYLSIYQPISFKFTNIVSDSNTPFAAGNLRYNNNGVRGNATIFLTLQLIDNHWRISQITIN
jgi:hypothetical protein